jgi:uncharacterized protein (TIGR03437 family)
VVNNGNFAGGENLALGDIAAIFGEQFVSGDAVSADKVPLPATLANAQVFVNDVAAPLFYSSFGQINFQIPFEATPGDARVRVDRNGTRGNTVSIKIASAVPRIIVNNQFNLPIVVNQDGSFPVPPIAGIATHPAKVGDALTIYAVGLGPTSPAVASGVGAPAAEPLARVTSPAKVCFGVQISPFNPGGQVCVDALFAGLTPNFVGLYQVNAVVPDGFQRVDQVPLQIQMASGNSNTVYIAVQ